MGSHAFIMGPRAVCLMCLGMVSGGLLNKQVIVFLYVGFYVFVCLCECMCMYVLVNV